MEIYGISLTDIVLSEVLGTLEKARAYNQTGLPIQMPPHNKGYRTTKHPLKLGDLLWLKHFFHLIFLGGTVGNQKGELSQRNSK